MSQRQRVEMQIKNIELVLSQEPYLDLHRVGSVCEAHVRWTECEGKANANMCVKVTYDGDNGKYHLGLMLSGVISAALPRLTSQLFLPELELENIQSSQLEGAMYRLASHTNHSVEILCREVVVERFDRVI